VRPPRLIRALDGLIRWETDVLLKPAGQLSSADAARGEVEHETLLIVDGGINLGAVEQKKGGHRSVSQALVSVDKRMALSEREAQRRCLLDHIAVEVTSSERGSRLGHSRFEGCQVTKSGGTTSRCEHETVQFDYLTPG
jgi:hypothetical protein